MYGKSAMEIASKDLEKLIALSSVNMMSAPGPVVNVLGFGARGDGLSDDGDAIVKAVDFCNENFSTLYFPKGIYLSSVPITISGGYSIIGNQSEIRYTGDDEINDFVRVDVPMTNYSKTGYGGKTVLNGLKIVGGKKSKNSLRVYQGKGISLYNIITNGGSEKSCYIGNPDGLNLWEFYANDCYFSARNDDGSIAEYALYASGNITDSFMDTIYTVNGSKNWAYIFMAASSIRNIHGYSYPAELACPVGFEFYFSQTHLSNVICDTPHSTGALVRGVGGTIRNLSAGNFQNPIKDERVAVHIAADEVVVDGVKATGSIGVLIDRELNPSIIETHISNMFGRFHKDIVIKGTIPWHFTFDPTAQADNLFKNNQYYFYNQYLYTNDSAKNITFRNPFPSNAYTVDVFEASGKELPPYKITNRTSTGFTFELNSPATEAINLKFKIRYD